MSEDLREKITVSLRLPKDVDRALELAAGKTGMTKSELVSAALETGFPGELRQIRRMARDGEGQSHV